MIANDYKYSMSDALIEYKKKTKKKQKKTETIV